MGGRHAGRLAIEVAGSGGEPMTETGRKRGCDAAGSPHVPRYGGVRAAVMAVAGFALYWPQLRSFEFSALLSGYANQALATHVMLIAALVFLVAFGLAMVSRRRLLEPRFARRSRGVLLVCCLGSLGGVFTLLAPHCGVLYPALFMLGAAGIALGYLCLTLAWATTFASMGVGRSLKLLAWGYAAASLVPLTDLLPLPVGVALTVLSPLLSGCAWYKGPHDVEAEVDYSFAGFRLLPFPLIAMIAFFLLAGRLTLGLIVSVDAQIVLPVRLFDAAMGLIVMLCIAIVLRSRADEGWGLAIKVAWVVLVTLFVAGMLLLVFDSPRYLLVGEGVVAAGFNCFEFVLWSLLVGITARSRLSVAVTFGCVFSLCKLVPMACGKLLVPEMARLLGWERGGVQLAPLMLVMVLLLVSTTFFFLAFKGLDFDRKHGAVQGPPTGGAPDGLVRLYGLTPREVEVMGCVLNGFSYQKAADEMGVSLSTVQSHVKNLYRKTGVHTRDELIDVMRETNR